MIRKELAVESAAGCVLLFFFFILAYSRSLSQISLFSLSLVSLEVRISPKLFGLARTVVNLKIVLMKIKDIFVLTDFKEMEIRLRFNNTFNFDKTSSNIFHKLNKICIWNIFLITTDQTLQNYLKRGNLEELFKQKFLLQLKMCLIVNNWIQLSSIIWW